MWSLLALVWAAQAQTWNLKSGGVEYRLRQDGESVRLIYYGPAGGTDWKTPVADLSGMVNDQAIGPEDLALTVHEGDGSGLRLVYRHRRVPLEIEARYGTWGETGVITRQLLLKNTGREALRVSELPEFSLALPAGDYDLTHLWGGWGQERQVATERLSAGARSFISDRGRSTSLYSPWFALHNATTGTRYLAQLAYSGNWKMAFEKRPGSAGTKLDELELRTSLGTLYDFGGPLTLAPGASRRLPAVAFTASSGSLDDLTNQLHRYQRAYVIPKRPRNEPPPVQFNSWYPFQDQIRVAELKKGAGIAAELGAEVFVLDSGWYSRKDWSRELGDYRVNRDKFPNGIEELADYVRGRGMKFGIWVEIENAGEESEILRQHPDWFLSYNGRPVRQGVRAMLDFAKPGVRQWAHSVVDRLVHDYQLEWLKIDYNVDIGDRFDPPGAGSVLLDHVEHYYAWLDEVRAAHPKLLIENCSSGGLRFDGGILAHTHTTWLSDMVEPLPSLQLAYGCTTEFPAEVCNHWMVGDNDRGEVKPSSPPGWWDFLFRVPMNGPFGFSSRVMDWSAELKQRAAANIALYKRLRGTILNADVYHLTPPPAHNDPRGWMAIQYATPDRQHSVVLAYRLAGGQREMVFPLRGLDAGTRYRARVDGGQQQELGTASLTVRLDAEWRAAVVEIDAVPR